MEFNTSATPMTWYKWTKAQLGVYPRKSPRTLNKWRMKILDRICGAEILPYITPPPPPPPPQYPPHDIDRAEPLDPKSAAPDPLPPPPNLSNEHPPTPLQPCHHNTIAQNTHTHTQRNPSDASSPPLFQSKTKACARREAKRPLPSPTIMMPGGGAVPQWDHHGGVMSAPPPSQFYTGPFPPPTQWVDHLAPIHAHGIPPSKRQTRTYP